MRKFFFGVLAWISALCIGTSALAAGVTLRVFTPFADIDFAAQNYMDRITAWEAESGNMVEDYSGVVEDGFMEQLKAMLSEGTADLVVVPVGVGFDETQLVTAQELMQAAPQCGARVLSAMAETDGTVLLTPVRFNWEALYVNTDVFSACGLNVPTNYEELVTVCAALSQMGIMPIANALADWPEVVLDCAALMGAPAAQYGEQASLDGAQQVLTALVMVGGFGSVPFDMSDEDAAQTFLNGEAAMRFDTDGLAQQVPAERLDLVGVQRLDGMDGQARTALVGTPSYGLALTRACWADDARCEAAISLAASLLGEPKLAVSVQGALGERITAMLSEATDCTGLLYDLNPERFDSWAAGVVDAMRKL